MTTKPPFERDESGRFLKPESEMTGQGRDDQIHPLSKFLFGWVEAPKTPLLLLILVITICGGLVAFDLILDRHEYIHLADITGFYAMWGFGGFALAVLSGWPLGKLLRRDEDYYGEADTTPRDVEGDQ